MQKLIAIKIQTTKQLDKAKVLLKKQGYKWLNDEQDAIGDLKNGYTLVLYLEDDQKTKYIQYTRFDDDFEDYKDQYTLKTLDKYIKNPKKQTKVNFLLKYDLDEDPIEEFETMKEVEARIKELLIEHEDDLQRDSIKIYGINTIHQVELKTSISIRHLIKIK